MSTTTTTTTTNDPAASRKVAKAASKARKAAATRIARRIADRDPVIRLAAAGSAGAMKRAKKFLRESIRRPAFSDVLASVVVGVDASMKALPALIEVMQNEATDAMERAEKLAAATATMPRKTQQQRDNAKESERMAWAEVDAMISGKGKHAAYTRFLSLGVAGRVCQYLPNAEGRQAWLDDVQSLDADELAEAIREHMDDVQVAASGGDRMAGGRTTTQDVAAAGIGVYSSKAETDAEIVREWAKG